MDTGGDLVKIPHLSVNSRTDESTLPDFPSLTLHEKYCLFDTETAQTAWELGFCYLSNTDGKHFQGSCHVDYTQNACNSRYFSVINKTDVSRFSLQEAQR